MEAASGIVKMVSKRAGPPCPDEPLCSTQVEEDELAMSAMVAPACPAGGVIIFDYRTLQCVHQLTKHTHKNALKPVSRVRTWHSRVRTWHSCTGVLIRWNVLEACANTAEVFRMPALATGPSPMACVRPGGRGTRSTTLR